MLQRTIIFITHVDDTANQLPMCKGQKAENNSMDVYKTV